MPIRFPNEHELKQLREKYPKGMKIRLIQMYDDPCPVPPGTIGEVQMVDDAGNIHMAWRNGSGLSLIEGADQFEVISGAVSD